MRAKATASVYQMRDLVKVHGLAAVLASIAEGCLQERETIERFSTKTPHDIRRAIDWDTASRVVGDAADTCLNIFPVPERADNGDD